MNLEVLNAGKTENVLDMIFGAVDANRTSARHVLPVALCDAVSA